MRSESPIQRRGLRSGEPAWPERANRGFRDHFAKQQFDNRNVEMGQKRRFSRVPGMSLMRPSATVKADVADFAFVPISALSICSKSYWPAWKIHGQIDRGRQSPIKCGQPGRLRHHVRSGPTNPPVFTPNRTRPLAGQALVRFMQT